MSKYNRFGNNSNTRKNSSSIGPFSPEATAPAPSITRNPIFSSIYTEPELRNTGMVSREEMERIAERAAIRAAEAQSAKDAEERLRIEKMRKRNKWIKYLERSVVFSLHILVFWVVIYVCIQSIVIKPRTSDEINNYIDVFVEPDMKSSNITFEGALYRYGLMNPLDVRYNTSVVYKNYDLLPAPVNLSETQVTEYINQPQPPLPPAKTMTTIERTRILTMLIDKYSNYRVKLWGIDKTIVQWDEYMTKGDYKNTFYGIAYEIIKLIVQILFNIKDGEAPSIFNLTVLYSLINTFFPQALNSYSSGTMGTIIGNLITGTVYFSVTWIVFPALLQYLDWISYILFHYFERLEELENSHDDDENFVPTGIMPLDMGGIPPPPPENPDGPDYDPFKDPLYIRYLTYILDKVRNYHATTESPRQTELPDEMNEAVMAFSTLAEKTDNPVEARTFVARFKNFSQYMYKAIEEYSFPNAGGAGGRGRKTRRRRSGTSKKRKTVKRKGTMKKSRKNGKGKGRGKGGGKGKSKK